ncbi:hypothetical protein BDV38DRAFT_7316 [Aspergillus pseudotamarii]|uniref:Uncharacterized protein n=1 Tax=Aspergillus pseudotamarii TaxID=132259 RepID=A0A5N6T2Y3_ASPPS|nr:uncharacterized protein BDV38DRAFT_7316 [Aspergillus pseudotamarii]KAE8140663.1 hypothetical protein BDV38DRAFT_7316 [Aspergillus pseudotamarii]
MTTTQWTYFQSLTMKNSLISLTSATGNSTSQEINPPYGVTPTLMNPLQKYPTHLKLQTRHRATVNQWSPTAAEKGLNLKQTLRAQKTEKSDHSHASRNESRQTLDPLINLALSTVTERYMVCKRGWSSWFIFFFPCATLAWLPTGHSLVPYF